MGIVQVPIADGVGEGRLPEVVMPLARGSWLVTIVERLP